MARKHFFSVAFFSLFCAVSFSQERVSIVEAAKSLKAECFYDPLSASVMLQKNNKTVQLCADDSLMVIDFKDFAIVSPPVIENGTFFISKSLVAKIEEIFTVHNPVGNSRVGAILIDPGHGGKDAGAIGRHTIDKKKREFYEKEINLRASKILFDKLQAAYPKKQIKMTRTTDIYLTLEQRVEIANSIPLQEDEAILYVSVHTNSAFDKKATGFEVWYLSPGYRRNVLDEGVVTENLFPIMNLMLQEEFTNESIMIAKFILDGIDEKIGKVSPNRGIKEEEWFVVRNAKMPSVLIELGFVSNKDEALLLSDDTYLDKIATGIFDGLSSFVTHFENSFAQGADR